VPGWLLKWFLRKFSAVPLTLLKHLYPQPSLSRSHQPHRKYHCQRWLAFHSLSLLQQQNDVMSGYWPASLPCMRRLSGLSKSHCTHFETETFKYSVLLQLSNSWMMWNVLQLSCNEVQSRLKENHESEGLRMHNEFTFAVGQLQSF